LSNLSTGVADHEENAMSVTPVRRRKYTRSRGEQHSKWVRDPLRNEILDALARKDWSISDLSRAIGSQPSLVSRWMMGARPNTESIQMIADALGMDFMRLMELAGHVPPSESAEDADPRLANLIAKLRTVPLTDERVIMLNGLMETMLKTPTTTPSQGAKASQGVRAA
jgi:transcriptional regulator with XRE-family HTH domain